MVDAREAAQRLRAAGDQVAAADVLRRALDDAEDPQVRCDLLLDLAAVGARISPNDAVDHYRAALALMHDAGRRSGVRMRLGVCLTAAGRSVEALDELDEATREASTDEDRLRATVAYCAAARCNIDTRPLGRDRLLPLAAAAEQLDPSEAPVRTIFGELAYEQALAGAPHESVVSVATRALGPSLEGVRDLPPLTRFVAMLALVWCGEIRLAERAAGLLLARSRRRGAQADVVQASQVLMNVQWQRGLPEETLAAAEEILEIVPEGMTVILPGTYAFRAAALAELGRLDEAVAGLELPGGPDRWAAFASFHAYLAFRARVLRLAGDPAGAHRAALQCGAMASAMGTVNPAILPWRSEAARAAHALGDVTAARSYVAEELALARRFGAPRALAVALLAAAEVADRETAAALRAEAAERAARTPDKLLQAAVVEAAGHERDRGVPVVGGTPARQRIVALGGFSVFDGGGRDVTPGGVAGRAVRVLVASGQPMHLEALAEQLWEDAASPGAARARLRNVLSRAQTPAGPLLVRRGDLVALTSEADLDVADFESAARRVLERRRACSADEAIGAVLLYGGDLLPSDPYADWAVLRREELRVLYLSVVDLAAQLASDEGRVDTAVELLEAAIRQDAYDESRYELAVDILEGAGRTSAARAMRVRLERVRAALGL